MQLTQEVTRRRWGVRKALPRPAAPPAARPADADLAPPAWAVALLSHRLPVPAPSSAPLALEAADTDRFTLATVRVAGARDFGAANFEQAATGAYAALAQLLADRPGRSPVRFWNHIPGIRHYDGQGPDRVDRYMVFNAGRFAACSTWFGSPDTFDRLLPTASAVGHDGEDLVVHVLASDAPGTAVENPRQIPSYKYSRRFGPRPPCFARATSVRWQEGAAATVLVGGTASIRGEETMHVGHLGAQSDETFDNLAALVRAAGCEGLADFESLRVYYVHEADRTAVVQRVAAAFPHLETVEYVRADLCRPDLLVEIEGVARSRGV